MMPESQIPKTGPLSILNEESDWTQVQQNLFYNGRPHLRRAFRIPIELLHFNLQNGRYHTKFLLLQQAHPGENIDPNEPRWRDEILKLLNGTWEDHRTGVNTHEDRSYFLDLVDDLRQRGQEHAGLVLENGGVMGGNRRLAALVTLAKERNEERFRRFEGFIVPGTMDAADRWRLEISAQMGQGRLLKDYDPVEKLLKIRQGVDLLKTPLVGEDAAIGAVATDFGSTPEKIRGELQTLRAIEEWLTATGHPAEYWRATDKTELFTEVPSTFESAKKAAISLDHQSKLKRTVFSLISNNAVDYRFMRQIRTSLGVTRNSTPAPSAISLLIANAPGAEDLKKATTPESERAAEELVDLFESDVESKKAQRTPLTLAQTAENSLERLASIVGKGAIAADKKAQVLKSVQTSSRLAEEVLGKLAR